MSNRRRQAWSQVRTLTNQIATVEAMSEAQWLEQWVKSDMPWMPKMWWLAILKEMLSIETSKLVGKAA